MKVLGIIGWSGSGKTTLLTALIPCLRALGFSVSTLKHAHHRFELDQPGKDSFLHRQAGAQEVIVANDAQFALHREYVGPPLGLQALLARLAPVDLVLVEGFKHDPFPKIEVHRPSLGRASLWRETQVLAVASDAALDHCPHPVLRLDQPQVIADFIVTHLALDKAMAVKG
jgi:molybdopterin-guanine dinucleotide biosynthesis protein B